MEQHQLLIEGIRTPCLDSGGDLAHTPTRRIVSGDDDASRISSRT